MSTNTQLFTNIVEKLNFEPFVDASRLTIGVTEEGVVTLKGLVKSYAEKRAAENAVKKVKGVKGIATDIEVDPFEAYKHTDTDIAAAAIHALRWHVGVPEERIKVVVEDGWITLSGEVEAHYQKTNAESAAAHLTGVRGVSNLITVKSKITPQQVKQQIEKEFHRLATLEANH